MITDDYGSTRCWMPVDGPPQPIAARTPPPAETPWAEAICAITVLLTRVIWSYDDAAALAWAALAEPERR